MRDTKLGIYLFHQLAHDLVSDSADTFGNVRTGLQLLMEGQPELAVRMMETVCEPGFTEKESPSAEKGCKYHLHWLDHPSCEGGKD